MYIKTILLLMLCIMYCGAVPAARGGDVATHTSAASTKVLGPSGIPLGNALKPNDGAAKKLAAIFKWISVQKEADAARVAAIGHSALGDECLAAQEHAEWVALLDYCKEFEGADSTLTAIVALSTMVEKGDAVVPTVLECLATVRGRFPDAWQSRAATLVEAQLLLDCERKNESGSDRARRAVKLLEDRLPAKSVDLPSANQECDNLLKMFNVTSPLRASYLVSMATIQYNEGCNGNSDANDWISQCAVTCKRIAEEYPGSAHAKWANDIANRRIPILRSLNATEGPRDK